MRNARQFDALHARYGYTLLLEFDLDAAPQFSRDLILPRWRGPHLQSHRRRTAVKALHTKNPRPIHQRLRPRWIAPQRSRGALQRLQCFLERAFRRERDVHERLRPVAAEVADCADLPIRDGHQRTSRIPDHCPPQREVFHSADVVGDLNRVADYVLIFKHDVKARNYISNERLRSEAHGQAGETCKRYRRQDVDIEFVQSRQQRYDPNNLAPCAI